MAKNPATLLLSLLVATLSIGCIRLPGPDDLRPARPVPPDVAADFAPPPFALQVATPIPPRPAGPPDSVRVVLDIADDDGGRQLALDWHRPATAGPHAVIVLLPVSGGHYEIERLFARYFAEHGFAALVVRRDESYSDDGLIQAVDPILRRSVVDGRRVVDWIDTRPEFAPGQVGLFGISLGGIEASVLAALEPRFKAAVVGLAGGDLPGILVRSNHSGLSRDRREWLAATGRDLRGAESFLRENLQHEPLRYAAYGDPARMLLILARFDRAVPFANGLKLRAALGHPPAIILPTGHYTAALAIPWLRPVVRDFFAARLAPAAGPAPVRLRTAATPGPG